jgi:hypothetical protein
MYAARPQTARSRSRQSAHQSTTVCTPLLAAAPPPDVQGQQSILQFRRRERRVPVRDNDGHVSHTLAQQTIHPQTAMIGSSRPISPGGENLTGRGVAPCPTHRPWGVCSVCTDPPSAGAKPSPKNNIAICTVLLPAGCSQDVLVRETRPARSSGHWAPSSSSPSI